MDANLEILGGLNRTSVGLKLVHGLPRHLRYLRLNRTSVGSKPHDGSRSSDRGHVASIEPAWD